MARPRPTGGRGRAASITGATDDLTALADLVAAEELWLHVDGAFGALARLAPGLAPIVAGIERADSLAFDLHKWGWLPFEVACVLVRDPELHRATFALAPSYIAAEGRGTIAGGLTFADRGIDLTRGFRALKVWMSFKAHGVDALGRLVAQNVDQARHLGDRVSRTPELELLAPVALNVVCFRYRSDRVPAEALDALNRELLLRIQESGLAVPSATELGGRYAIRVAIVNHRTRREDLDLLVDAVLEQGRGLAAELGGASC